MKHLKTSVTLEEKRLEFARAIAKACGSSVSEVVNKSLEQMQELVEAQESAPNLSPWARLYREQVRRKAD